MTIIVIKKFYYHSMIDLEYYLQQQLNLFNSDIKLSTSQLDEYDYQILVTKFVMRGELQDLEAFVMANQEISNTFKYQISGNDKCIFMSFTINKEKLFSILENFYDHGNDFELIEKTKTPKKILYDYSSPNLAKDMHVGHLKSTILGDTLANISEYLGNNVTRVNHIGDFGLPFGMIIEYVISNGVEINESTSLQQIYTEAKKCFEESETFKTNSYIRTGELQSESNELVTNTWKQIFSYSLKSYQEIYDLLRISKNLTVKGESYYAKHIGEVKKMLNAAGLIEVDDKQRTIVKIKNAPNMNPMIYEKSEERGNAYTYDTTDIATLWYRIVCLSQDEIYYVVDTGQSLHFKQLFEIGKSMGWLNDKVRAIHVDFGVLSGLNGVKIQSRLGNTPKLLALVNDGVEYTKKSFIKKQTEANELNIIKTKTKLEQTNNSNDLNDSNKEQSETQQVQEQNLDMETILSTAIGSIKYFDLSKLRTTSYQFEFSRMLKPDGNTYTYLAYSFARCKAVMDKLIKNNINLPEFLDVIKLEDLDYKVLRKISEFPSIVNRVDQTQMPHYLCDYLYKLTSIFNENYTKVRCINFDENENIVSYNESRVAVYLFFLEVSRKSFELLGLPLVNKI